MTKPDAAWADERVTRLLQHPAIQQARALAAMRFRIAHGRDVPEEAWPSFESAMDEWCGNYLYKSCARDPRPRFVHDFLPPRSVDGAAVAGARMGGDNPDNYYRLAGIEHGGRYRVTGRRVGAGPANTSFTLAGNWGTSVTIDGVENDALTYDADGRFEIVIDAEPIDDPAHLTTQPNAKFLFVRDSMNDWSVESPLELAIERLDEPGRGPLSDDEVAEAAAFRLVEEVPLYFWFHRIFSGQAPNTMDAPYKSGGLGGLVTQAGSHGRVELGEDDCAVIRFTKAGAAYSAFELTDWWFRSIDAHRITSSLTDAQCTAQPDGTFDMVIARRDPGVRNWLDTGGLAHALLLGRWQGLSPDGDAPAATLEMTTLSALDPASGVAGGPIDAAGRAAQLAQRRAEWCRRTGEDA